MVPWAGDVSSDAKLPAKLHELSIFLSLAVAVGVGVLFGWYPGLPGVAARPDRSAAARIAYRAALGAAGKKADRTPERRVLSPFSGRSYGFACLAKP